MLLLAALFGLIGLDFLKRLIEVRGFALAFSGGALLGGAGLSRDQITILSALQRLLRFVLPVLAPVLAIRLVLVIATLPFTGLATLWQATRSMTSILLASVIGALVLANVIIADHPADESRSRVLRFAAAALAVSILPLAIIAAVSL